MSKYKTYDESKKKLIILINVLITNISSTKFSNNIDEVLDKYTNSMDKFIQKNSNENKFKILKEINKERKILNEMLVNQTHIVNGIIDNHYENYIININTNIEAANGYIDNYNMYRSFGNEIIRAQTGMLKTVRESILKTMNDGIIEQYKNLKDYNEILNNENQITKLENQILEKKY